MHAAFANPPSNSHAADAAMEAFKGARLEELARMRRVGMACAERIGLAFAGGLERAEVAALAGKDGLLLRFLRTQRAVRQIVILEMELVGLRQAPDRDRARQARAVARKTGGGDARERPERPEDLRDRSDYDTGPYDEVVARVRRELGTAAPANDPFAPPEDRKAPEKATASRKAGKPTRFRLAMSATLRKIVYGPVVTLRMALLARGDVLPILDQGFKARYLAGEFGRGRGPPW
jgi:hypothetical protein